MSPRRRVDGSVYDLPVGAHTHAIVQTEAALRDLEDAWSSLVPEDEGRVDLDEAMLAVRVALDALKAGW